MSIAQACTNTCKTRIVVAQFSVGQPALPPHPHPRTHTPLHSRRGPDRFRMHQHTLWLSLYVCSLFTVASHKLVRIPHLIHGTWYQMLDLDAASLPPHPHWIGCWPTHTFSHALRIRTFCEFVVVPTDRARTGITDGPATRVIGTTRPIKPEVRARRSIAVVAVCILRGVERGSSGQDSGDA